MPEVRPTYDGEIDLFEFFETFWDGKWVISFFIALAALIGFVYSQFAQPKYKVSAPFVINAYSVSTQQICVDDTRCMELETTKRLLSFLDDAWSNEKNSVFSFSTFSPLELNEYEAQLVRANAKLTNDVYTEATTELTLIQTELTDALLNTERVATNMLNAKRVIQSIDNGQSPISLGSVSVVKTSPKVLFILASSVVLGGMIGVFLILVRSSLKKRKELLNKT